MRIFSAVLVACFSLFEPRLDVLAFKTNQKVVYEVEHEQQNEPSPWSSYKQFSTVKLFLVCVQEPETPKLVKMRSAGTRVHFRKYTWEWEEGSGAPSQNKKVCHYGIIISRSQPGSLGHPTKPVIHSLFLLHHSLHTKLCLRSHTEPKGALETLL